MTAGHEGSTHFDGRTYEWTCRCGARGHSFPSLSGAEDDLRIHLALSAGPDDRSPVERLTAFAALYHPAGVVGAALHRAVRIARGDEPVPAAVELTADERAAVAVTRHRRVEP